MAARKVTGGEGQLAVPNVDPWRPPLERVHGKIDYDGLERVSSQTLLDILDVPQRSRTAGTYRHLATIMSELGWTAVRVRDLTRGGYKEQVRGYCRDTRCRSTGTKLRACAPCQCSYQGKKVKHFRRAFR